MSIIKYGKIHAIFLLFLSSYSYSYSNDDMGVYGSYWKPDGTNSMEFAASTPYASALAQCSATTDCVDMVYQSDIPDVLVKFKRQFSNGGLSIVQFTFVPASCDSYSDFVPSCQEGYGAPEPQVCEDGFLSNVQGYEDYCDRPNLIQCPDSTYVDADYGICPQTTGLCTDFDTCYNYALSYSDCEGATVFDFNYTNPTNWGFGCTVISAESPDNSTNGGNQDGNIYNDPYSPPTPTIANSDNQTVSTSIGSELQDDFGNVERAIREGIDGAHLDSGEIKNILNSFQSSNSSSLSELMSSNLSSSQNIVNSVNGVKQSVDNSNLTLSEISGKLENISPCEPTEQNNYCESPHGLTNDFTNSVSDALQTTIDEEKNSAIQSVKDEIEELKSGNPFGSDLTENELTDIFAFFTEIWPQPTACIPIDISVPSLPVSLTISCEFSDKFKEIFSFLISIYTIMQLIEILMSPIKPKLNGA